MAKSRVAESITPATEADIVPVLALLDDAQLPTAGFVDHLATTLVARDGVALVGSVTLELYGEEVLLRSLAVSRATRGLGLGQRLVGAAVALARESGARRVWLLTTTAERFFPRFGFDAIARDTLPGALSPSAELRGACPASAVAMMLDLGGRDGPPARA